MKINIKGLKCDNFNCNWIDISITREEYTKFIGMKCPKCGDIILTQADYDTIIKMEKIVKFINFFTWPFEKRMKKLSHSDIKMNGSWKVEFSEVTEVDNPYYKSK